MPWQSASRCLSLSSAIASAWAEAGSARRIDIAALQVHFTLLLSSLINIVNMSAGVHCNRRQLPCMGAGCSSYMRQYKQNWIGCRCESRAQSTCRVGASYQVWRQGASGAERDKFRFCGGRKCTACGRRCDCATAYIWSAACGSRAGPTALRGCRGSINAGSDQGFGVTLTHARSSVASQLLLMQS